MLVICVDYQVLVLDVVYFDKLGITEKLAESKYGSSLAGIGFPEELWGEVIQPARHLRGTFFAFTRRTEDTAVGKGFHPSHSATGPYYHVECTSTVEYPGPWKASRPSLRRLFKSENMLGLFIPPGVRATSTRGPRNGKALEHVRMGRCIWIVNREWCPDHLYELFLWQQMQTFDATLQLEVSLPFTSYSTPLFVSMSNGVGSYQNGACEHVPFKITLDP
ncbi:hypothetical protein BU15DRAFT_64851 [Melanogaster broomeanus]|nr:hypothetical protein BU15DRAFT_64851 [Melanogaster broomeanus]